MGGRQRTSMFMELEEKRRQKEERSRGKRRVRGSERIPRTS